MAQDDQSGVSTGAKAGGSSSPPPPSLGYDPPAKRPLKVYAFDPSLRSVLGNVLTLEVRYEPLAPGPVGERFAVVDYDGSTRTYYAPVNLDDPAVLIAGGLDPSESDPRFHQQMVYAVASETLERFEAALGRQVHWRRVPNKPHQPGPNRLYLYPHAMVQANAFYSPDAHGILFGYFRAGAQDDSEFLPGQTIFTCLSHDIIAHEVTHAIVDGVRSHFLEPTNIDVAAFHEAFADLAALFRHFSHREALLDTLQRTGGRLYTARLSADAPRAADKPVLQAEMAPDNPLIELARQFGQTGGSRSGLRSALGVPANPTAIRQTSEPHARGAILVAAVFDAYFSVYLRRTADIFRVFRAGGGAADPVDLPGPLANLLAEHASKTASMFFAVCARALDYCPPTDVTFGDYLRALITADLDLYPVDTDGVRDALMQAFRARGITPEDAEFFSEQSLCWRPAGAREYPEVTGLKFGDPNGLTGDEKDHNGDLLRAYAKANFEALGFENPNNIEAASFHPMFRVAQDGVLKIDMVVELIQSQDVTIDPSAPSLGHVTLRGGVTLMIAQQPLVAGHRADPVVRYAIPKHLAGRAQAQARSLLAAGGQDEKHRIDFALLHGA